MPAAAWRIRRSALDVRRSVFSPFMKTVADTPAAAETRPLRRTNWHILYRILDLIIGGIFIYAGLTKVIDPVAFANDIDNYKILPWPIGVRLAFYLPWLEVFCGLAVVSRRLYLGGLSILASLTTIFIMASIAAKVRGIDITCGCFGHASKHWSFTTHLAVDFGILILLVFLIRAFSTQRTSLVR